MNAPDAGVVLELDGLHKRYGREQVLRGLSLRVARGEIVGLLGPNGCGKTTTLRIAAGYAWADAGSVRLNGAVLSPADAVRRAAVGYLPERAPLYDAFRVERYLRFIAAARGLGGAARDAAVDSAIRDCRLQGVRRRVISRLSKGYRQRVGLAQSLLGAPDLLLLDEPTNGLDPFQIVEARALIRAAARDRAVIFSTHIMQEVAALCTRVVYLSDGRLVELENAAAPAAGTPRQMRAALCTTDLPALLATVAHAHAAQPPPRVYRQTGDDVELDFVLADADCAALVQTLANACELRSFAPAAADLEQRLAAAISADAQVVSA